MTEAPAEKSLHEIPLIDRQYARVSAFMHDAGQLKWVDHNAVGALVCVPVLAVWLVLGIMSGRHKLAGYAVAGAVSLGFGAFQNLGPRRMPPMLLLLTGLGVATWIGSVSVATAWFCHVMIATACGFAFGAVTMLGYGGWWIGLQWMIALVVYGAHPAGPREATRIALAVLAGGASQYTFLLLTRPITGPWFHRQRQPPFTVNNEWKPALRSAIDPAKSSGRYAIKVASAMAISTTVAHFWSLPNDYWIPMTAATLMKPDLYEASVRGVNRLVGTVAGAAGMTLILATLRPPATVRGVILIVIVWSMYTVQRVNYAVFAGCVTAYIVLLFSSQGLPELPVALHRVLSTLAGSLIALLVSVVPMNLYHVPVEPGHD